MAKKMKKAEYGSAVGPKKTPAPKKSPAPKKAPVPYGDGENADNLNKLMELRKKSAGKTMKTGGKMAKCKYGCK